MRLCVFSLSKEDRHREKVEVLVFHSLESKHFSKRNLFFYLLGTCFIRALVGWFIFLSPIVFFTGGILIPETLLCPRNDKMASLFPGDAALVFLKLEFVSWLLTKDPAGCGHSELIPFPQRLPLPLLSQRLM